MTALEKWKNDFKEFISELSIPRDDYKGIMAYINEVPNEALEQKPCEDVVKKDCGNCAYYDNGANDEACNGCFEDEEHLNFKPKAQPCEDCISRQAVDELSKELVHTTRDKADFLCNFWEGLQKLPPVTPKEKTGQWINNHTQCSNCKRGIEDDVVGSPMMLFFPFCPNCGARMVSE